MTDLMYRHWDHYVESIQHPFVFAVNDGFAIASEGKDILEGEPFECPMEPFGGMEQLAWSTDSKNIAFTCRCKTGLSYSVSTDSDIFLYDVEGPTCQYKHARTSARTMNGAVSLKAPFPITDNLLDPTKTLKNQFVNTNLKDMNVGYDTNPKFSPDGRYVAWLSMERDGYEADRNRLCVYDLKEGTKTYVTESFDSNVDDYCWAPDSKTIYYIGVWHATENLYRTNLQGEVKQHYQRMGRLWFPADAERQADSGRAAQLHRHLPTSMW